MVFCYILKEINSIFSLFSFSAYCAMGTGNSPPPKGKAGLTQETWTNTPTPTRTPFQHSA
jgi:hypothetical protein